MNLYYGKLFSKYYQPYKTDGQERNFNELLMRGNYERAISIGEKMLEKDPVNFAHLLKMLRCYVAIKQEELAQPTKNSNEYIVQGESSQ